MRAGSLITILAIYEKARAANYVAFSVFVLASRSLLCECECNTSVQGRSGIPYHRYDRSPLEPQTQQFRLRYPALYRNSFLESYVYVANPGTRSICVVFLLFKTASFWSTYKLSRSLSENLSANCSFSSDTHKIRFFYDQSAAIKKIKMTVKCSSIFHTLRKYDVVMISCYSYSFKK